MPRFSKWSLLLRFSNQNFPCVSHRFHACYMPCPPYPLHMITFIICDEVYKL
jgi:hypothetical protein